MEFTVWSLAIDGKDGTESFTFASEKECSDYVWENHIDLHHDDLQGDEEHDEALARIRAENDDCWSNLIETHHWEPMTTISVDCETFTVPLPPVIDETLQNAAAVIDDLLHQIGQMQGMFDDEDGTIEEACDGANETLAAIEKVRSDLPEADKTAMAALDFVKNLALQDTTEDIFEENKNRDGTATVDGETVDCAGELLAYLSDDRLLNAYGDYMVQIEGAREIINPAAPDAIRDGMDAIPEAPTQPEKETECPTAITPVT